ncbi:MAG: PPC domain-containing DNA-binding protein [Candidatus Bipolaricaulia bacterium]
MFVVESGQDIIVRLQPGEDLFESLGSLNLTAGAIVCGIGMLRDVTLAFWTGREYKEHEVSGPAELLSLQGNFSVRQGKSHIHCHAVLGLEDGSTVGGHLSKATVHETNEIYIRRLSGIVMERKREPSGLFGLYPRRE